MSSETLCIDLTLVWLHGGIIVPLSSAASATWAEAVVSRGISMYVFCVSVLGFTVIILKDAAWVLRAVDV